MKKIFLWLLIIADVAIIAVSGFFLYMHLTTPKKKLPLSTKPDGVPAVPATPAPVITPSAPVIRKIGFSYTNAKAKSVSIRADFTGWKAEPMKKNVEKGKTIWKYTASLAPGDYAYCFTVDGNSLRDPANTRTKQVGKTFVSAITVTASPNAPPSN